MGTALIIISIVVGTYEVLSRSIPTIKDISILGKIIQLLKVISDALNNKK